jgi:hypothetical protein
VLTFCSENLVYIPKVPIPLFTEEIRDKKKNLEQASVEKQDEIAHDTLEIEISPLEDSIMFADDTQTMHKTMRKENHMINSRYKIIAFIGQVGLHFFHQLT